MVYKQKGNEMNNIYRENGVRKDCENNTKKNVELKVNSDLYQNEFMKVGQTSKNVMLAILKYMDDDLNTIQIGGDTMECMMIHTGYNKQVIRNQLKVLFPIIEKTGAIRGEYIVSPTFAVKGSEALAWESYASVENRLRECRGKF